MGSRASRDLGLARIGKLTRWMAVGMVVGGGVLSAAVAQALPGRSSKPATAGASAALAPGVSTAAGASGAPQATAGGASAAAQSPAGGPTAGPSTSPGDGSGGTGSGLSAPVQAPQPVQAQPVVNSGGS